MDAKNKKILVVEDDRATLAALSFKLQVKNIKADTAKDGQEAIEKIKNAAYDVILLDILLPKINGFTVLEEIRKKYPSAQTKVYMISNLGQAEEVSKAMSLGADGYIVKAETSLDGIVQKVTEITGN
ncbi:MAG: response regulator [Parcubacteria group bacterium]|nr:response regulator [Parcubacteria group bacterium]